MSRGWMTLLLVLVSGCGAPDGSSRFPGMSPTPAAEAMPAKKKELPWLQVPGGRMKTTLFYGPWQCNQKFMRMCLKECGGLELKGCMWLADIKLDWEGHLIAPPLPVKAGSRYPIFHCCCNYRELSKEENQGQRDRWNDFRDSFRDSWSQKFGKWPLDKGEHWPGHHIHDLKHGGNPIDPNNILPVPPDTHGVFNRQYPGCYKGGEPWNRVGPDLPYRDN